MKRFRVLVVSAALTGIATAESQVPLSVGVAKVEVTPREPVLLAGYGSRNVPYEGIDTKLWARAMVIGDAAPVAIVVLDNCGVPGNVTRRLAARLTKHGIVPERLVVAATHTHNAPNLVGYAPVLWAGRSTPEQDQKTADYTRFAIDKMEQAVRAALENREPMCLSWAQGRATFGGNRRVLDNGKWAGFGFQQDGPVDHSLPVLAARDAGGKVRAVWANYACHCTTVGARNHVGGDWAGFANESMEQQFPAAVSLMSIGCGADIGPQPSGNLELARRHGSSIGVEIQRLLAGTTKPLSAPPEVVSKRIRLPLEPVESRPGWVAQAREGGFRGQLAKRMLERLDRDGSIPPEVDYPLAAWKFGDDLAMVFLAGEVVVDYSLRLNRELDWSRLWITAWANEMPGYIPSRRILAEGGYEPDFSQVYYGQPARYAPAVEDRLTAAVHEILGAAFTAKPGQPPAPFHRAPTGAEQAFARVAAWAAAAGQQPGGLADLLKKLRSYAQAATPAIATIEDGSEQASWQNFAGDSVPRRLVRQETETARLAWKPPPLAEPTEPGTRRVLCFTGGLGWESQPEVGGFALVLAGETKLTFDVTRQPASWAAVDGSMELLYLPTWTSHADSGGFFFLAMPAELSPAPTSIAVKSLGSGSKRWFAIDSTQEIAGQLTWLRQALAHPEEF